MADDRDADSVSDLTHAAANVPLIISWFETAAPSGPALGDPERTTWSAFSEVFTTRREGEKDGPNFVPAQFTLEPGGRQVRRLKANLIARTAIALDIETNKKTREIPPALNAAVARIKALELACIAYTSHNHKPADPRYRLVFPLSARIPPELPAAEVMADTLGLLGVLDTSKVGASSLFYLPSAPEGALGLHQTIFSHGAAVRAGWMQERAGALLAARQADADRIATEAQVEAAAKREVKLAAGFDPDDSLIEKLRSRLDLATILTLHGYAKAGTKYRHPNSSSGSFGADIKVLGGIERVFSHNGTDLLHADNLPAWCDVTAIDAFDATVILDFGGDRKRAMRDLAERFGLTKGAERKALAGTLFRLLRERAPQGYIEATAFREGERVGLSRAEVIGVAVWVAIQASNMEATA